jgi:hypothetical protein
MHHVMDLKKIEPGLRVCLSSSYSAHFQDRLGFIIKVYSRRHTTFFDIKFDDGYVWTEICTHYTIYYHLKVLVDDWGKPVYVPKLILEML